MAGIFANVDSDIDKLKQLKSEIEGIKEALKSINVKVDTDIAQGLEAQLKSLTTQYDALVQKVSEAQEKIVSSVNQINSASEKIIKAQEQLAQASGSGNAQSTENKSNNAATQAETASLEAQAKAYRDLKDAIEDNLGTLEGNAMFLAEIQTRIKVINQNISVLEKSISSQGYATNAQVKHIAKYTQELEELKLKAQDARRELKTGIRIEVAGEGSLAQLRNQLLQMQRAWDTMTETTRNSPIGQEFAKSIDALNKQVSGLEQTMGRYQRNVGNYASGWNGLNMSIQQIGRELPSLAVGWNTFFLAISNNLPILADEIKRAKTEYEALKKSGQQATPVWKQIVSSLLSWQTALTVGITLLTLYGGKLVNWVSGLFSAKKALSETYKTTEEFQKSVSESSAKILTTIEKLSIGWQKLGGDIEAQKRYIIENKEAFDSTGIAINTVADAENLLVKNKEAFVNAITEKSKAMAIMELASKEYENYLQKTLEAENRAAEGVTFGDRFKSLMAQFAKGEDISGTLLNADLSPEAFAEEAVKKLKDEAGNYQTSMRELIEKALALDEESNKKIEDAGGKTKDTLIEASVGAIEAAIAKKKEALKYVTNRDDYAKIEAEIKAEQAKLDAITGGSNKKKNQITDQQSRIAELERSQTQYRIRLQEDLENQVTQARIDAMEDGYEKEKAQRELNNQKELQDIERQKQEYIQKTIQAQKEIFDAQEELKAKQDSSYHKQSFDASSVSVDTSAFDAIYGFTQQRQDNDILKAQEKAWNEYYLKYGDYLQKRNALIDKYDKELANTQKGSAEEALLLKERANALDELDNSIKGSTSLMGQLFADASEKSVNEIQKIIDKAELLMDYLSATKDSEGNAQIKGETVSRNDILNLGISENTLNNLELYGDEFDSLRKAIKKLKGELSSRSPFLQLESEIKKVVAQIKSGNLTGGLEKLGGAISSFTPAMSQFGEDLGTIFGNDELGDEISGIAEAIGGLGETAAGVGQALSGDIAGGVMSAVSGIASIVSGIGGLFGADYSDYNEMVEQYSRLLDVWDDLIDKKKEYIDISYGVESVKAAEEALALLEKQSETVKTLAEERLGSGASIGSHSIWYRMWKGSYKFDGQNWQDVAEEIERTYGVQFESMYDLLDMSPEILQSIKENYSGLWSVMDDEFREYLENLISYGEEAEEIVEQLKEAITGIDFSSFQDSFIDLLSDLDSTSQDFADDFESYLQNAIFSSLVANQYKSRIQSLYDQWTEYASDYDLSTEEVEKLREEYQQIINDMLADREQIMSDFGWTSSSSSSQEASTGAFETMSQDSADELNGRFTALQMSGETIATLSQQQLDVLNSIYALMSGETSSSLEIVKESYQQQAAQVNIDMQPVTAAVNEVKTIVDEMRTRQAEDSLTRQESADNLQTIVQPIRQIQRDTAEVKQNTARI